MKRIALTVSFFLFCLPCVYAEVVSGYGVKTGLAMANQEFNYTAGFDLDTKNRTGFDFGLFVEWFDLQSFSGLTEVHYVQKGMIEEDVRTNEWGLPVGTIKFNHQVDYLSIPLLVKITQKTKHLSPYLCVGPRFDFLLGYKSKLMKAIYDKFKNMDTGGTVAVGVESRTRPIKMLLELRYSPDLTFAYQTDLLKVKNHSFELLLGLKL